MRVATLTPTVVAAPGEQAICRLRIENDQSGPLRYDLRVIGFDPEWVRLGPPGPALAPGDVEEVEVGLTIPDAFAAGHHAVGFELRADRPGSAPVITGVTVTVGEIDDVVVAVVPATVRGRRRGTFLVDVDNRAGRYVELDLAGEGPDLQVRLRPQRLLLEPDARTRVKGRVRGPRHVLGDVRHHPFNVIARGRSRPTYAPAAFQQRPLLPRPLRTAVAALLIVAIWASALGGALLWWNQRDEAPQGAMLGALVDTDGDGIPDTPGDQLIDTDGDGVPDTPAATVAEEVAAGGGGAGGEGGDDEEAGPSAPTSTVVGGVVKAGETGEDAGVAVTLSPLEFGAPAAPASGPTALLNPVGEGRSIGKLWPARYGTYETAGRTGVRRTVTVETIASGPDGAFLFPDVGLRQSYRVDFALAGFDSQAFVVTPTDDGEPVQLEVQLEPADGSVSGTVLGPSGPLGNVALRLTDGTLTFDTTTSSAEDSLGTWSLEGVSTPATYTLTATLPGFGTEVLQVPLDPGEEATGVDMRMTPGVGSIGGRITAGGQRLGGVTLTATGEAGTAVPAAGGTSEDGEAADPAADPAALTTTSLTEGDAGSFRFPTMTVPGRYTITASAEGYLTQSRLVTLTAGQANVDGVDFDLVRSTGTVTGLVVSDEKGPLSAVNIAVSGGELTFNSSSAAAPDAGAFRIGDLPPGDYVFAFSRFDHPVVSRGVTVSAGQVVDLGQVLLTFSAEPTVPTTGSVTVRVTDSENNDLTGATVRLVDVGTGEVAFEDDDSVDQATFVFERVPVGTYLVQADRVAYGRAQQRISVGLGPVPVTLPMFLLGQASGRLVDSVSGAELDDYVVTLFRLNPDGTTTELPPITVVPGAPATGGPNSDQVRWETPPNSLVSGRYRVEISRPPPGYRVLPDAILQDLPPPGDPEPAMEFVVSAQDEEPVDLLDIEADRFPNLRGMVTEPLFDAATGTTAFVPIDDDTLTVELTCAGVADPLPATEIGSGAGGPEADSFLFGFLDLAAAGMTGNCSLLVHIDDPAFPDRTVALPTPLLPTNGTAYVEKVVNVAIFADSEVGGRVYWVDPGTGNEIGIGGVDVRTQGQVIIGFEPGEGNNPQPATVVAPGALVTLSGGDGAWSFGEPRQVFGRTTYVFRHPDHVARQVGITIDEGVVSAEVVDASTRDLSDAGGVVEVEMDALGGAVTGTLTVRTVKPVADITGFSVALTPPATVASAPFAPTADPRTGTVLLTTADPGTYTATITPPDGHRPIESGGDAVPFVQQPNRPAAFASTWVALGQVDVAVLDGANAEIDGVTVELRDAGGVTVQSAVVDGTESFVDVDPGADPRPDLNGATYQVVATVPAGFDAGALAASVAGGPSCLVSVCGNPVVEVRAGDDPDVVFTVPRFGSISGTVVGDLDGNLLTTTDRAAPGAGLTVVAQRVDAAGAAIGGPTTVTITGNQFTFSDQPGDYTITVAHPEFGPAALPLPPDPNPAVPAGRYRMVNVTAGGGDTTIAQPFVLPVLTGSLDITVLTDTLAGGGVDGATVTAVHQTYGTSVPGGPTLGDGRVVLSDLVPGPYEVTVRKQVPVDPLVPLGAQQEVNYPVIVSVSIQRSADADVRSVVLRVPFARIGGSIAGTIIAENSRDEPIALPATIAVDRTYTAAQVEVDGDLVDPDAPPGDIAWPGGVAPASSLTLTPAGATTIDYDFDGLPTGSHGIAVTSAAAGYEPAVPADQDVTVVDLVDPADAVEVRFEALDRPVEITVNDGGAGELEGMSVDIVDLNGTGAGDDVTVASGTTAVTGIAAFSVPPATADYEVRVEDPDELFAPATAALTVAPGTSKVTATVPLVGAFAIIQGTARKQTGQVATSPLVSEGSVRLLNASTGAEVVGAQRPDGQGGYLFEVPGDEVPVDGNGDPIALPYVIEVVLTGATTERSAAFAAPLGRTTTAPTVTVRLLADFAVTVNGPPANSIAVAISVPAAEAGVTPTRSNRTFTFADRRPGVAYTFVASSPGCTSVTTGPHTAYPNQNFAVPAVTLSRRTISGTVTPAALGTPVRAVNGTAVRNTTTNASGGYSFADLPTGTWTITSARLGAGRDQESVVLDADDACTVDRDLALQARTVAITYARTPSTASVTPASALETAFPVTWSATATGYTSGSGTIPLSAIAVAGDPLAATPPPTGALTVTNFPVVLQPVPTTTTTVAPTTTTTVAPAPTTTTTVAATTTSSTG